MQDYLLRRVNDLAKKVSESLENHGRIKTALDNASSAHNHLVGRLDEARYLYEESGQFEKKESVKEKKEVVK